VRGVRVLALFAVLAASRIGASGGAITADAAVPSPAAAPVRATPATGLRPGVMPLVLTGTGSAPARAAPGALPPPNAHLSYFGGPVISAIGVVQVLYGSGLATTLAWENQVKNAMPSPSVASFYGGITNSPYLDWMSEYSTTGSPQGIAGTNQAIVRGGFLTQVSITPSAANDPFAVSSPLIDDSQIQDELSAQIAAGTIPAPQRDAKNNIRTLYAIYFPHGVTITIHNTNGTIARSGADFCAYHGTTSRTPPSQETYYSVLPDFTTNGMSRNCGSGSEFQNVTAVSSHELGEAITDPEVGFAPADTPGPPLAWYDVQNNGEAADLCNGVDGSVIGGDGLAYTVQKVWSNAQGACVLAPGPHVFSPHGVGAPQVAVTPDGSTQLVFWKDATTNQLAEAWYTGAWNGPVGFPQLGTLTSTPAVAVTKDGSTQLVFWQGPSGHLFEAWYTGSWNGPLDITSTYLGGHAILGSAPSVVTTKEGSQLIFWRGTDGHLAEAWFSATWHGPVDFSTLGSLASAPSATITADGSTQLVFFQGTDNRLTEDWFTGVWNGPMTLGSLSSQPSVAVTPDGSTQLVFYKSAAGHLLESWYTGTWNGPVDFTTTAFGGTGLLTSSPSATVTVDGSTQLVFWQGSGATLWEGWYAGGAWHGPVDWSG
jgi:hypothetical protein